MKFTTALATIALANTLGTAAPVSSNPPSLDSLNFAYSSFCGEDDMSNMPPIADFKASIDKLCHPPHEWDISPDPVWVGSGPYYINIQNSQGGDIEPCESAFKWIADNCYAKGKLGQVQMNANSYRIDKA